MYKYNISKNHIFKGAIVSSVFHAIMMCTYPLFNYQHSWDGGNYSAIDDNNIRGTISFCGDICVGVIRNEETKVYVGEDVLNDLFLNYPKHVLNLAKDEALQYMLEENELGINPHVSLAFWCDENYMYTNFSWDEMRKRGLDLFSPCLLSEDLCFEYWVEYYAMNQDKIDDIKKFVSDKITNFDKTIVLKSDEIPFLNQDSINDECRESFAELGIILI